MATWANQSKNSTGWSNQGKNSATWANDIKATVHPHLLLENGNFFTTESGFHILLESSVPGSTPWANMTKN